MNHISLLNDTLNFIQDYPLCKVYINQYQFSSVALEVIKNEWGLPGREKSPLINIVAVLYDVVIVIHMSVCRCAMDSLHTYIPYTLNFNS